MTHLDRDIRKIETQIAKTNDPHALDGLVKLIVILQAWKEQEIT